MDVFALLFITLFTALLVTLAVMHIRKCMSKGDITVKEEVMKVYVLNFYDMDDRITTVGVFSSYSAMLTCLNKTYGYTSVLWCEGWFKEWLIIEGQKCEVGYEAFDVIGEHSHKTNTINFKEI